MAVQVHATSLVGVEARQVQVEVDLLRRLPRIAVVGLPASEVRESAERLRSAVQAAGYDFPRKRVVINLAPADLRKDGCALDLPMALGILAADGQLEPERLANTLVVGELSLGGALRPVRGAVGAALLARELGMRLLLPDACAQEAALVPGVELLPARTLEEAAALLKGEVSPRSATASLVQEYTWPVDLADVRGQPLARRALEVAAVGGHHLLMVGPPGCGKSMLAQRLVTLLPPLTSDESLEVYQVRAAAGLVQPGQPLFATPPFRAPHHTVSIQALVGGRSLRPGEMSLAHNGVLFLDEAPEFSRQVLEGMRAPLEDGQVLVSRASGQVRYPSRVQLVLAANPCPCGHRGGFKPCDCTDHQVLTYRRKLSGPIRDRVDLHLRLQPLSAAQLLTEPPGEDSQTVRERVVAARAFAHSRGQQVPNGRLSAYDLVRFALLTESARQVLFDAAEKYGLSGRATNRVMKVARSLADLERSREIAAVHVLEALSFRPESGPLD